MADRRLQWNQIAAPDLSGASAAIARANQSFTSGIQAGKDALGAYGAAQQENNDNELLGEIAGLNSEDALDAFLTNTNFNERNISSGLRDTILGRRDEIIGYNQGRANVDGTRARTDGTRASTAISQAVEGRNSANYSYGVQRRDELTGLSGAIVNANAEGNQYGRGRDGVQSQVYQGMLDRGLPEHVAQGFMMNFQDESGFDIGVTEGEDNVHGTRGKGLYQLTGARREAFEARYGNDYSIDNQLDWLMEELGGSESSAGRSILASTNAGEAGAAIVSNFLRPAEEHRASRSNAYLGSTGSYTPPAGGNSRPQFDALSAALAGSQTLTPSDISGLLGGAYQAQEIGQGRLDSTEAARIAGVSDQATLDTFSDPTVNADPQTQLAAARAAGLGAGDTLDLFNRIGGTAEANPGIFSPTAPVDPLTQAAVQAEQTAAQRALDTDPQQRLLTEAESYEDKPAAQLIRRFNLDPSIATGEELDATIDLMADRMGVTRGQAAVALAESYTGEPSFFSRDNLSNRFDSEAAVQLARDTFGPDARTRGDDARLSNDRQNAEFQASQTRMAELQSQALRYQSAGQPVPEEIAREITGLQANLRAGTTPQQTQLQLETYLSRTGTASRLDGLDPESPEFFRAIADLEAQIQGDRTLDADQKELLISAIRG